ncbi:MAG: restriction endonuclease subunit S [Aeriscardovia sp.]|nr:restriction endonuclease subunit S [Aeriscardovia sp.]
MSGNVPAIRFAGFTEPWEQRKLGDVAEIVGGGTPDTNNVDYWDGVIDWYSPAELGTQIYVDGSARRITEAGYANSSAKMLPAERTILFTSRAGIGTAAILRRPACTNQGFQSIVVGDEADVYFLFSMTDHIKKCAEQKAAGSTFLEVSGKQLAAIDLKLPALSEQRKIGSLFQSLDSLITLHQRKHDQLATLKKSLLEKMFPKPGSDIPELRFAGFTEPWEQRKLGDIATKVTKKNSDLAIQETFTNSAERGVVSQLDYFDHDITNDDNLGNYIVVEPDDFVYNPRISVAAPVGPINRNCLFRAGVMSPLYTVFRVNATVDHSYLEHYFNTSLWHAFMNLEGNSGARSDRFSISDSTFFEMPISCPRKDEQSAIAVLLERFDSLITLHQRKHDQFATLKKSLLDKMFV